MPEPDLKTSLGVDIPDMPDIVDELVDGSPLRNVDPNSIDELLDRVNEALVAGTPHIIRADDDRLLTQMVEAFREEAREFIQREKDKPRSKPRSGTSRKRPNATQGLDL